MPLYYFNPAPTLKEFYTDAFNMRHVLGLAGANGHAKFKSLYGSDLLTGKTLLIHKRKISSSLKIISEWLPAEMVLRRILDLHLNAKEFILEFDNGMIATCTALGDLVIRYKDEGLEENIFSALDIPIATCGILLCNPGALYFANRRVEQELYMGHFKSVDLMFQQKALENKITVVFEKINVN